MAEVHNRAVLGAERAAWTLRKGRFAGRESPALAAGNTQDPQQDPPHPGTGGQRKRHHDEQKDEDDLDHRLTPNGISAARRSAASIRSSAEIPNRRNSGIR